MLSASIVCGMADGAHKAPRSAGRGADGYYHTGIYGIDTTFDCLGASL